MNIKKVLFTVLASVGIFALAATAFAAAYAPGDMASGTMLSAEGSPGIRQVPQNTLYFNGIPNSTPYRAMPEGPAMAIGWGSGRTMAWYGLVFVITIILVWAVLLLLIAVLWKILCKHRKG